MLEGAPWGLWPGVGGSPSTSPWAGQRPLAEKTAAGTLSLAGKREGRRHRGPRAGGGHRAPRSRSSREGLQEVALSQTAVQLQLKKHTV